MTNAVTTYNVQADFGAGYTVSMSYDFLEQKFSQKMGSHDYTCDYEEALGIYQEMPEKENARVYKLFKQVYDRETGDSVHTLLLMKVN